MIILILPTQYEFNILRFIMPEKLNGRIVMQSPGMGKLRTLGCLYETLHKFVKLDWIILAGYAGSLDKKSLPMGATVECVDFVEGDFDAGDFEDREVHHIEKPTSLGIFQTCRVITADQFLQNNPYKPETSKNAAVDMEAYAVAKFCTSHDIPFSVVKVISDIVGKNDELLFKKMAVELADKMNEQITLALDVVQRTIDKEIV